MKISKFLVALVGAIALLTTAAYYYVFILGAPQLDAPQEEANTGLKFQLANFNSQAMGTIRNYGVILPPGYHKNQQKRYPVIFLLHGGHDDARAFADKYAILDVLYELYKTKKLPPSIVITPDGNDNRGSSPLYDPDYFDGPNGKLGTLIGSELVQVVKSRYRTLEEPQYWALGGISSGGWGAFNIGLRYLNNFHILFSHSGYFTDSSGSQNSPQQIVQQLSPEDRKQLRVYLDAGVNDSNLLASTKAFHETLTQLGIIHVFYAFPGGHGLSGANIGWNYFHKHLKDSLSYVGEQFQRVK
ncbi:esterase [Nostoc linckia z18]|uniref:Esterase n=2 Tax=Nostoc linckia TaxID=92942 RepID=A0A9Q6EN70_NOSLI|nr:alpha/beta hydrolase-fold protein [Nostoc linckia]PHK39891.1 esterase [Nostoc linckia z15]PHK43776.1 esterase [Nostoc linckia z16]PHJ58809.1 esterase [Nostoc linckia z1]PHJ61478.1 esterase [Nostoc linckia z3]PHJ61801.1 esterase [Nostoc linckia z2]